MFLPLKDYQLMKWSINECSKSVIRKEYCDNMKFFTGKLTKLIILFDPWTPTLVIFVRHSSEINLEIFYNLSLSNNEIAKNEIIIQYITHLYNHKNYCKLHISSRGPSSLIYKHKLNKQTYAASFDLIVSCQLIF